MTARPIGIAVFALLALAPLLGGAYALAQLTLYVIYGMLAMSLALIWGRAGLLCFGQAMFFGIGAYAMAISTKGMAGEALASTYARPRCSRSAPPACSPPCWATSCSRGAACPGPISRSSRWRSP